MIISFDGKDIPTSSDLPHVVGLIAPGTRVAVVVMRDKKRKNIKVEVGGLDADDSYSLNANGASEEQGGRLGLIIEEAPPESLERSGLAGGVLVREVVPGSVAAEAGVLAGDIITLIGSSPVKSVEAFQEAVGELGSGSSVPLRLMRRGSPMFIGLKLSE